MQTLMKSLQSFQLSGILSNKASDLAMDVYQAEKMIAMEQCCTATPLFVTKKDIGEDDVLKVVCFVIHGFQRSLHLPNDRIMDSTELVIASGDYIDKYTHDSIIDLIQAFKDARHKGTVFYNKFSQQDLNQILNNHFEAKAIALELMNRNPKRQSIAPEVLTLIETTRYSEIEDEETEPYKVRMARKKAMQYVQEDKPTVTEDGWKESLANYSVITQGQ
jgi:hypothetical protein